MTADLARFRNALPARPSAAQRHALDAFLAQGFPTPRLEDWKFTNLAALAAVPFAPEGGASADAAAIGALHLPGHDGPRLVFVNGRFRPELSCLGSLPGGILLAPLSQAEDRLAEMPAGASALAALNAALAEDGLVLRVPRGVALDAPIHAIHWTQPGAEPVALHARSRVVLEAGAAAALVETTAGAGARDWANLVTHVDIGADARLAHVKLQAQPATAFHTALTEASIGRGANYCRIAVSAGGGIARDEIAVTLAGAHAECRLDGVTLATGRQLADTTIRVTHAMPHGTSAQNYRAAAAHRGHTVFQGRIHVAEDAQKTAARQLSRSLLLSPQAQADAKPELEILADDVTCSHGATVGDLDREALFYLKARGIGDAAARALLVEAFAAEPIDGIPVEPARLAARALLKSWLAAAGENAS